MLSTEDLVDVVVSTPRVEYSTREKREKFLLTLMSQKGLVRARIWMLCQANREIRSMGLDPDEHAVVPSEKSEQLLLEIRRSGLQATLKLLDDDHVEYLIRMTIQTKLLKNLYRACVLN